jgi:hypothetical protein
MNVLVSDVAVSVRTNLDVNRVDGDHVSRDARRTLLFKSEDDARAFLKDVQASVDELEAEYKGRFDEGDIPF